MPDASRYRRRRNRFHGAVRPRRNCRRRPTSATTTRRAHGCASQKCHRDGNAAPGACDDCCCAINFGRRRCVTDAETKTALARLTRYVPSRSTHARLDRAGGTCGPHRCADAFEIERDHRVSPRTSGKVRFNVLGNRSKAGPLSCRPGIARLSELNSEFVRGAETLAFSLQILQCGFRGDTKGDSAEEILRAGAEARFLRTAEQQRRKNSVGYE